MLVAFRLMTNSLAAATATATATAIARTPSPNSCRMPPKRPTPSTETDLMPPPPPSTFTSISSKRRRLNITTPSIPTPPSLFFTIPAPPPAPLSDDSGSPPSDRQFTDFLLTQAAVLPPGTQSLYNAALANLAPDNTPDLTSEMRASLTAAVTAFTLHLLPPAVSEEEGEGEGEGEQPDFLRRLAAGDVSGRELVNWADTITAALMASSAGSGGSRNSPALSSYSTTPTPSPATPTHTAPISPNLGESHHVPIARSQSHRNSGRSAVVRERTLTRDEYACVVTGLRDALALEVAHIIPFSVRGEKAAVFWAFLGIFLGDQGAEALRGATLQLAGGSGSTVGEVANCMVLDVRVHRYFDGGIVEIVPVMGSGEWGLGREYDPSLVSSYDISIHYPGGEILPLQRFVYSTQTPPRAQSFTLLNPATRITLTTSDPATMPLPHPLLLQLHSLCGRVKRLRAAAGWPVLPYGNGSDDGVGWGEEEVEGWYEDEHEEQGIEGRWEGDGGKLADGIVSPAESVEGWVLGCAARTEAVTEQEEPGTRRTGSRKRRYGAALGEVKEGEVAEDGERPRKVAVVMGEMGRREEERLGLLKG